MGKDILLIEGPPSDDTESGDNLESGDVMHAMSPYYCQTPDHESESMQGYSYSLMVAKISLSLNRWNSCCSARPEASQTTKTLWNVSDAKLTSSPSFIEFPPQLGNRTRSPIFTDTGCTTPSLSGAPGPMAITVASGSGEEVDEEGRKMPVEVFWFCQLCVRH